MKSPREAAFEILYRIHSDSSYSNLTLDKVQKENNLSGKDAAFCTALTYGVLERQLTLDYIIRQYSSLRLKKIEPKALIILRMGVYQLLYMDSVHAGAAVNESVNLAKKLKLHKASGFINGLLRSFVRADLAYKMPDEKDKVKYLSVKFSCPEEIVKFWLNSYPEKIVEDINKQINSYKFKWNKAIKSINDSASFQKTIEAIPSVEIMLSETVYAKKSVSELEELVKYSNITSKTSFDRIGSFVVVDTETTGLSSTRDNIIELAVIKFEDWIPVAKFHTLINPKKHIPDDASAVNGITDEMVAEAPWYHNGETFMYYLFKKKEANL